MPLEVKSVFVKFILETYFPPAADASKLATDGDAEAATQAMRLLYLEQRTALIKAIARDLEQLLSQLGFNDQKTKQFIDPFIFKRVCVCVCVCVCIYIYIYIYVCVCVCLHVHLWFVVCSRDCPTITAPFLAWLSIDPTGHAADLRAHVQHRQRLWGPAG